MRRPQQTTLNIAWNYGAGVVTMGGAVLLFPVGIAAAGVKAYALWILCTSAVHLFAQADLGFGAAAVRFLARARAVGDEARVARIAQVVASSFYCLAFVLPVAVVAGLAAYIPTVAGSETTTGLKDEYILLAAVSAFCAVLGRLGASILEGFGRSDLDRQAALAGFAVKAVGLPLMLIGPPKPLLVASIETAAIVVASVLTLARAARRVRLIPATPRTVLREGRDIFHFGLVSFATSFFALLAVQAPLYLVASHLSLIAAALFAAWVRVYTAARIALTWLNSPSLPIIAQQHALSRVDCIRVAHRDLVVRSLLVASFISMPLILVGQPMLAFWLGESLTRISPHILAIAGLSVILNALYIPGAVIAAGLARSQLLLWPNFVWCASTIVLVPEAASSFGVLGACLGVVAPLLCLSPLQFLRTMRMTSLTFPDLRRPIFALTAVTFVAGSVLAISHVLFSARAASLQFGVSITGYVVCFIAFAWLQRRSLGLVAIN